MCTQAARADNLGTVFNESTVVLGIESSFDDTAVGIVQGNGKILGEAVHSQLSAHKAYATNTCFVRFACHHPLSRA